MSLDLSKLSDDELKALYSNTQAIHNNESNGAPDSSTIRNPDSGAEGSMQVVKGTQRDPGFGVKPSDGSPEDTARAGRDYYAAMNQKYGDPFTAAVAYDWGPGNADKWIKNGAKLSDLPEETLKYAYKMHQQQGGGGAQEAPAATPVQAGAKAKPQAPQQATTSKDDGGFLKTADDFIRGAADTMTFGMADKFAAKMDELTGRTKGTTYDQNLAAERQKDKDGGVANTVGQVAGAFVPGLGVLKAAQAPATASRLARAGYGAASGAAMGAVSGVGHNDDDSLDSKASDALHGAMVGGAVGGVIPAVLPATLEQKAGSFIKKAGGDEKARRIAEASQDLEGLASREAQGGKPLHASDVNMVRDGYLEDAAKHVADPEIKSALLQGRRLNDAQLASLPENVREVVNKAITIHAQTGAKPAWDNIVARGARTAVDFLPVPRVIGDFTKNYLLGGRETRESAIKKLIDQAPVASKVLEKLGPSKGAQALTELGTQAQAQAQAQQAIKATAARAQVSQGNLANSIRIRQANAASTRSARDATQAQTAQQAQDQAQQAIKDAAARAQASQANLVNSLKVRQGNIAATRSDQASTLAQQAEAQAARTQASQGNLANSLKVRQEQAAGRQAAQQQAAQQQARALAQQAQAAQAARDRLAGRVDANAANRPVRPAPEVAPDPAIADAARKAASRARLEAKERAAQSTAPVRSAARASQAEEAATAAAHAEGAAKVAQGHFPDAWDQKGAVQTMLSHVDIDPKNSSHLAAVKETLQKYASESADNARDVAQFLGKGTKKLDGPNYYGINDRLKAIHGSRTPPQASQGILSEAPGAGALTVEDELRKIAYQGGKQNRQNYAKEAFEAAPTETTRTVVSKLSTLKSPEARGALFDSIYATATDAEKKFMDQKVKHMIHYRKPE